MKIEYGVSIFLVFGVLFLLKQRIHSSGIDMVMIKPGRIRNWRYVPTVKEYMVDRSTKL